MDLKIALLFLVSKQLYSLFMCICFLIFNGHGPAMDQIWVQSSLTSKTVFEVLSFSSITYVGSGYDLSRSQDKDANGSVGMPSLPAMQKKPAVPVRSVTSGSSREQSEDDELERETETTANMDPADAKRVRR